VLVGGGTLDELPLTTLIGECVVVDMQDTRMISEEDFAALNLPPNVERLIFNSSGGDNQRRDPENQSEDAHLTLDAANWMVTRGIKLVGIDTMSVDQVGSKNLEVHRVLLESGVTVLESLDLSNAVAGEYWLICLPMKLIGCDGSPVRAVLVKDFGSQLILTGS